MHNYVSVMTRQIMVKPRPGNPRQGFLSIDGLVIKAALGRGGIGIGKAEGDGKTPRAAMRLLYGYWRADRGPRPVTALPMYPLRPGDTWCDASDHPAYNHAMREPMTASHEKMYRDDGLYDICVVMDWNITSRRRGAGSAIFLHVARPGYLPTEGCIAVSKPDMYRLLKCVSPQTRIVAR